MSIKGHAMPLVDQIVRVHLVPNIKLHAIECSVKLRVDFLQPGDLVTSHSGPIGVVGELVLESIAKVVDEDLVASHIVPFHLLPSWQQLIL